ncbi:DNA-binding MurR/RpiR family transcriptional regulator [Paenarthrobacter nitroguajacolicus]|uniref:MurR/RpiR family transcriptional regulator n=1 Tax=Paenarthrobacter nitroguajacolicus TaxID=211146 RepID=UPI0028542B4F|nr:MurR/RpiR family transcriptional regulator [Paenarthrobacter nitroguajacolicus]MDR6989284.1 DNA-binding MurR/RpiR family transcriptional regulator [Paenarthrobacter nitroguajacolicus]
METLNVPFQERYASADPRLTPSERKVGDYLLRNPDEVIRSSAIRIAEVTGTSDATVIRTIQNLGYGGLKELKQEFLENVLRRRSSSASLDPDIDLMLAGQRPVMGVLADSASVLDAFLNDFDDESFDRAVDLMASARRIYSYGLGPGGMMARFLALNLNRVGFDARSITQTGYRLADDLLPLRNDDCVVLFAPYHQTVEVEVLLDHTKAVGASVVLVTEALGHSLKDRVQVVMRMPSTVSNLASEYLAPLTFSHAVSIQLASMDRERSLGRTSTLNQLTARFEGSLEMPSPRFLTDETDLEEDADGQ